MDHGTLKHISYEIIGCAYKVHSALGPGVLESAYEVCMAHELVKCGYTVQRQVMIPLEYDGVQLESGFRLDLLVADEIIVELKAVDRILPVHQAQIITYLKLMKKHVGLLLNFHEARMREGIHRFVI
ncbi:MAG: GxxExxY protein [Bacteroidetes bacterium]|nr:GxxExxY protein [Bacteroidota bacterium]